MADNFEDLDDLYNPPELGQNDYQGGELTVSEISKDVADWNALDLDTQCDTVLTLLSEGKYLWDRDPDCNIPPLEDYKKETLATRKGDSKEPTRMTALHCLARSGKKSVFENTPKDVCIVLINHLLQNQVPNAVDQNQAEEPKEKMLVLEVALYYENDKFIDCVRECLGKRFPAFLHRQDDNDKNCLHHLFAWPPADRKNTKVAKSPDENRKYNELLRKLALQASPETLATADREGNTPIHYAMHLEQCYDRDDEYAKIVKVLILRADRAMEAAKTLFNSKEESPIMYARRISIGMQEENNKRKLEALARQEQRARGQNLKVSGQPPRPESRAESRSPYDDGGGPNKAPQKEVNNGQGLTVSITGAGKQGTGGDFPEGHRFRKVPTQLMDSGSQEPTTPIQGRMLPPGKKREPPTTSAQSNTKQQQQQPGSNMKAGDNKSERLKDDGGAAAARPATGTRGAVWNLLFDFLKAHYTVTRSDLEARDLIWGRGAEGWATNLYFDARGLQEAPKILEVLERMKAGGFGSTLSYVSIPALRHVPTNQPSIESIEQMHRGNMPLENPRLGRTDLTAVFDKLRELKVKSIWRLEVEDRQFPPRTDATIERAIRGRDDLDVNQENQKDMIAIEVWDWRKPDLSTDVIAFAAPTAKVVNLYWSGNQTVLKAWGCEEGIPRLHSITGVERIIIHASPGIETLERMELAKKRFKETLKLIFPKAEFERSKGKGSKDKIEKMRERLEKSLLANETHSTSVRIEFTDHRKDLFASLDTGLSEESLEYIGDDPTEKQHAWVDVMDKFRGALASILPKPRPVITPNQPDPLQGERVRVALIDDGVNLANVDMYAGIVKINGLSFHSSDRQTENPWHLSTGGHGTVMANMILRVNPWVDLYVIRLHCAVNHNQGRTISALSAAQAIKAAIDLKVKIISVSWTIKYRGGSGTTTSRGLSDESRSNSTHSITGGGGTSKPAKQDPLSQLMEAITKVKKEGILMFCSASDDIQTTAMKVLPYSQEPDHIYRIGAALWLGQRDPTTETPDRIDWFFPGNQVAEAKNPRAQGPIKYHDGSSVGTALAAGLASLIIFLARLVHRRYTNKAQQLSIVAKDLRAKGASKEQQEQADKDLEKAVSESQLFGRRATDLEDRGRLKQALDMIGRKGHYQPDKKYLPVWDTFNPAIEVLTTPGNNEEKKWEELGKLIESLCSE